MSSPVMACRANCAHRSCGASPTRSNGCWKPATDTWRAPEAGRHCAPEPPPFTQARVLKTSVNESWRVDFAATPGETPKVPTMKPARANQNAPRLDVGRLAGDLAGLTRAAWPQARDAV